MPLTGYGLAFVGWGWQLGIQIGSVGCVQCSDDCGVWLIGLLCICETAVECREAGWSFPAWIGYEEVGE